MPQFPPVYGAVRAVGTLRPKFNPVGGKIFADELNVVGTAFWLKEEKALITCAHVVQNLVGPEIELTGLLVVGNSGNYRRALIGAIDVQHDLALLKLLGDDNKPLSGEALVEEANDGLALPSTYPSVGDAVAYAGFPLGNQLLDQVHSPTYSEGVVGIQRRDNGLRREIQISGAVVGGFSGSPVVLKEDSTQVLGAIAKGPVSGGQSSNIFMALIYIQYEEKGWENK